MCLKQSNAANTIPLTRSPELFLANTIERIRMPYKKPLYWK